jgi:aspartyl-tRNA(Asn)/glutamyl-tRNA(Gln) amidotransferase subunit C
MPQPALSDEDVRRIAKLSRLELPPERVEQFRDQLSSVLGYIERLRGVSLEGVEPLSHVHEGGNRLDEDVPGKTLPTEALMRMAPESMPPFVRVPKVIGDGGGA